MTPTSAHKQGAHYRYYVACVLAQGRKAEAGSRPRVPAPELEATVLKAVRSRASETARERLSGGQAVAGAEQPKMLTSSPEMTSKAGDDTELIVTHVARVVVGRDRIEIAWRPGPDGTEAAPLIVPWPAPPSRRRGVVHAPDADVRPIRSETRARLLQNIADARAWLGELVSGRTPDMRTIAEREGFSERHVRTTLNLAFLAPDIVRATLDGTLPDGCGVTRLSQLGMSWSKQRLSLRSGRE